MGRGGEVVKARSEFPRSRVRAHTGGGGHEHCRHYWPILPRRYGVSPSAIFRVTAGTGPAGGEESEEAAAASRASGLPSRVRGPVCRGCGRAFLVQRYHPAEGIPRPTLRLPAHTHIACDAGQWPGRTRAPRQRAPRQRQSRARARRTVPGRVHRAYPGTLKRHALAARRVDRSGEHERAQHGGFQPFATTFATAQERG